MWIRSVCKKYLVKTENIFVGNNAVRCYPCGVTDRDLFVILGFYTSAEEAEFALDQIQKALIANCCTEFLFEMQ